MATSPDPTPNKPEVPVPDDHRAPEQPINPRMTSARHDPLPPEAVNRSQEDEEAQSQTLAVNADDFGLEASEKTPAQGAQDDVQDLVDHMHDMVRSGRIDMDAYRGERSDDDENGVFGPEGDDD